MDRPLLARLLREDEGLRLKPYLDCCGRPWRLCACASKGKLTIGYGRNLDDGGIWESEAEDMLAHDALTAEQLLDRVMPWWRDLSDIRQVVLADMAFNLGSRLLEFVQTLDAMRAGRFEDAARKMLLSRWALQVGRRAKRLSKMMETGREVALSEVD